MVLLALLLQHRAKYIVNTHMVKLDSREGVPRTNGS